MKDRDKELKRRLERLNKKVEVLESKHRGKGENFTYHGGYDLGYLKGKIGEIEEQIDIEEDLSKKRFKLKGLSQKDVYSKLNLREHSAYKIKVKVSLHNVTHHAILFTGFREGGYNEIYVNSYDGPISLMQVYQIEIIKNIGKMGI